MSARKGILWVVAGLFAGLLLLPAIASAANGGTSSPPASSTPTTPAPTVGAPTSTAGALAVSPATLNERQVAVVTGAVPAVLTSGHGLWLQVRQSTKGGWVTVASAAAASDGSFTIPWRTSRAGQLALRVVSAGVASTSSVTTTPQVSLTVYEPVVATWYGPGFYGNHTACGEKLTRSIVGLADRTLPCGTPVSISYNGQTLTLPVIDRGPYSNGATLDLTSAAAQELGMTETSTVEMLSLGGPLMAPTNWFSPTAPAAGATGASGTSAPSIAGGATAPAG
ncbi:MAG TPA: septal ring lytic transglycosylase RlpA family protein [Solirubrobacteraceae bacterium]